MIGLAEILSIGEKVLDRVLPNPEAAAQAKLELAKMAEDGRLREMEAQFRDIDSARQREALIATSDSAPLINKIVTPVLGLGTIVLSFVLFGVIIFMEVKHESKDILIYVLGVLSALVTQICSYYFGSSQGSKDKAEELKKALK
jgi:hypothetical protein